MEALVIVDVQNDFMPGGPLAIPRGHEIIPIINALVEAFRWVLAVKDWHPKNHTSFATTHSKQPGEVLEIDGVMQELWPPHCIQNTPGAEFVKELDLTRIQRVFKKGIDKSIDSYGGFFDNGRRRETGLEQFLKNHEIKHIYLVGLTTDYCVKYTALDGVTLGFEVTVITDACRALNVKTTDEQEALDEMAAAGVQLLTSKQVLAKQKAMR